MNRFDLNGQRNTITYRNKLTSRRLIEKIRDHHGYSPLHPAGLYMSNTNQTVLSKILKNATKPNKPDAEPCGARILTKIPGLDGRLFCQNHANHASPPFLINQLHTKTYLMTVDSGTRSF